MKKFKEWFIINDILQIWKYGLVSHLNYLFNYSKTVVYVQIDLSRLPKLPDISPLKVRELSLDDENDLKTWADIINIAYEEEQYDAALAKDKLTNHEFLKVKKVFLVFDGTKCIGTVSAAVFKSNPNIASGCRFAVHPDYRSKGLGKYLYLLILHVLNNDGYKYFESTMAIKRETSFIIKFKLGFYPQFNRRYVQYKKQKRFFLIRLAANYRLYVLWRRYKKSIYKNFIPTTNE